MYIVLDAFPAVSKHDIRITQERIEHHNISGKTDAEHIFSATCAKLDTIGMKSNAFCDSWMRFSAGTQRHKDDTRNTDGNENRSAVPVNDIPGSDKLVGGPYSIQKAPQEAQLSMAPIFISRQEKEERWTRVLEIKSKYGKRFRRVARLLLNKVSRLPRGGPENDLRQQISTWYKLCVRVLNLNSPSELGDDLSMPVLERLEAQFEKFETWAAQYEKHLMKLQRRDGHQGNQRTSQESVRAVMHIAKDCNEDHRAGSSNARETKSISNPPDSVPVIPGPGSGQPSILLNNPMSSCENIVPRSPGRKQLIQGYMYLNSADGCLQRVSPQPAPHLSKNPTTSPPSSEAKLNLTCENDLFPRRSANMSPHAVMRPDKNKNALSPKNATHVSTSEKKHLPTALMQQILEKGADLQRSTALRNVRLITKKGEDYLKSWEKRILNSLQELQFASSLSGGGGTSDSHPKRCAAEIGDVECGEHLAKMKRKRNLESKQTNREMSSPKVHGVPNMNRHLFSEWNDAQKEYGYLKSTITVTPKCSRIRCALNMRSLDFAEIEVPSLLLTVPIKYPTADVEVEFESPSRGWSTLTAEMKGNLRVTLRGRTVGNLSVHDILRDWRVVVQKLIERERTSNRRCE